MSTIPQSTTPRTDAECIQIYSEDITGCSDARDYVDASFARTLETELAAMKAENQKLWNEKKWCERDAMKAEAELAAEREWGEGLREALELITNQADACKTFCDTFTPSSRIKARVALAATKEASK